MDSKRIDALARALALRLSRRGTFQVGAGAVGAALLGRATAADTAVPPDRYLVIRQYQLTSDLSRVTPLLPALTGVMAKTNGVVTYSVVDAGNGTMFTVGVFVSKAAADAAIPVETRWIQQDAAALLSESPPVGSGKVLAYFNGGVDCPCDPTRPGACGQDTLVCCAGAGAGTGTCAPKAVGCAALATPVSPATPAGTETAAATTPVATEAPPATAPAAPPVGTAPPKAAGTSPAIPQETSPASDGCCVQFCLGKPAGRDQQLCQEDCLAGRYEGVCTGTTPGTPATSG